LNHTVRPLHLASINTMTPLPSSPPSFKPLQSPKHPQKKNQSRNTYKKSNNNPAIPMSQPKYPDYNPFYYCEFCDRLSPVHRCPRCAAAGRRTPQLPVVKTNHDVNVIVEWHRDGVQQCDQYGQPLDPLRPPPGFQGPGGDPGHRGKSCHYPAMW